VITTKCDVAIIGGGPAGAIAASLLANKGRKVQVFESQHFPRFSIGESLLPHCVEFLTEAGLYDAVAAHGFQFKDGAMFSRNGAFAAIDFRNKSAPGPATVYQVRRDQFDDILIHGAMDKGAEVHFGAKVTAFEADAEAAQLTVEAEDGTVSRVEASFVMDASGFGRVLPRLLNLDKPSDMQKRRSCFRHIHDHIDHPAFDRDKILVTIHPDNPQVRLWLIPLADGMASIGAVGEDSVMEAAGDTPQARLDHFIASAGILADILSHATEARPTQEIIGFSRNVSSLTGNRFVLLGNAAEFLDPVFSSGVTIAMKSASLAAGLVERTLEGEIIDWEADFTQQLKPGIEAFRACVNAWYDGLLPRLIFFEDRNEDVTRHFTSILAGYAWDQQNPIVREPKRFFKLMDTLIGA